MKRKRMSPVKFHGKWKFPSVSSIRFSTLRRICRDLPGYVTYSEFQKAMGKDVVDAILPTHDDILRVTRQVVTGKDFLGRTWMHDVRKAWRKSIMPKFSFVSDSKKERYWWCDVESVKGWSVHTYILLAVDDRNRLVRYAFYSGGSAEGRDFYIRFHDKYGRETEVQYKTVRRLLAGVRKMTRSDDNMICCEKNRDEYIQTILNRDGSFYVEYQLYHMTWQMCCQKMHYEDLARLIRKYCSGGIVAVANEFEWRCISRPERQMYDLGALLKERLRKAVQNDCDPVIKTIQALEQRGHSIERIRAPLFVGKNKKPKWWEYSFYYLPKRSPKRLVAAMKICAALTEGRMAYELHNVGDIFLNGEGVARDYKVAFYWEMRAKKLGNAKAISAVTRLKHLMDPKRLEKSASLRGQCEREVDEAINAVANGRLSVEGALDSLFDLRIACECDMYDGKLAGRDYDIVENCLTQAEERLAKGNGD